MMLKYKFILFYSCCLWTSIVLSDYQIGIGIADCTGPVTEIRLMGYAKLDQVGCGLHLRQYSRAFIIDDSQKRVAFISIDSAMMCHGVRREVLKKLNELYGDIYTENNLILSGTHTHGTPGGFLMDLMLDIPSLGFVNETFNALVAGITQSITNAHENMVEGKIFVTSGELLEANINRSPASYLLNPEEERAKYTYDVDKEMVQVKFVRSSDGNPIGAINWFAVHPTSMNNTNCLVTSDNVGYASTLFETYVNNGKGPFVGAFASTNLGDVSPNTKGPICIDTGEQCDFITSTCDGVQKTCIAFGPGDTMMESTKIIAEKLYNKAQELFLENNSIEITGPVKFIHQFVQMPNETVTVTLPNGTVQEVQGCVPALGYSFAGGTTDGPGEFDFAQGTLTENDFWNAIRDFLFPPTEEQKACQSPKPILLNPGGASEPYQWIPDIVSTQMFIIGNLVLIAVPGEFTTMSGRRLRDAVKETIINNGGPVDVKPVITGLSNVYTNYIATPEEYQLQRYEAASTLFGPYTLDIYLQKYKELASALMTDTGLGSGPTPPDFSSQLWTFVAPAIFDLPGDGKQFGDCLEASSGIISIGQTVSAKFVSGNPRHNALQGDSFLYIERLEGESWNIIETDNSWNTRLMWQWTNWDLHESMVTIEWDIPENTNTGTYRIRHKGHYKLETDEIMPYEGICNSFIVTTTLNNPWEHD